MPKKSSKIHNKKVFTFLVITGITVVLFFSVWTRKSTIVDRAAVVSTPSNEIQAVFKCGDGKSIDATFINSGEGSVSLTLSDGRSFSLPYAISADGERYADSSENIVFWNKGNTAFLEENGKITYDNCATDN